GGDCGTCRTGGVDAHPADTSRKSAEERRFTLSWTRATKQKFRAGPTIARCRVMAFRSIQFGGEKDELRRLPLARGKRRRLQRKDVVDAAIAWFVDFVPGLHERGALP